MIEIARGTPTERTVWKFSFDVPESFGANASLRLRLHYYGKQARQTPRHKWRGVEFWHCHDERRYYSRLPRPTSVPDDILAEATGKAMAEIAKASKDPIIYVGWWSGEYMLKGGGP